MNHAMKRGAALLLAAAVLCAVLGLTAFAEDAVQEITVTAEGYTITSDGVYHPAEGSTGIITLAPGVKNVTIVGNGAQWDSDPGSETYGTILSAAYDALYIDCSAVPGVTLTLRDIYIRKGEETCNMVNFSGTGNRLVYDGTIILDNESNKGYALIHVDPETELTIYGTKGSRAYLYKYDQAAGIGGNTEESCGTINLGIAGGENDFYFFMKGSKQGAVIGNGSNISDTPSTINFYSGIYNLVGIASGAIVGGSGGSASEAAGNVCVYGGLINLSVGWAGAAIGGGGFKQSDGTSGNDKEGGNLYVSGGSIRTYLGENSVANGNWPDSGLTGAGVSDNAITATKVNAEGEAVYMLTVDTSDIAGTTCTVAVDDITLYTGPRYGYYFAYEDVNRSGEDTTKPVVSTNPLGTPGNWVPTSAATLNSTLAGLVTGDKTDNNLYFYVTGEDHTVSVNGTDYDCVWDAETGTFTLTQRENAVVYGDVDGDGVVRATDAMLVNQYAAMMDVQIDTAAADVDGDGVIRATDAMLISQYAAMIIEEFPVVSNG